MKTNLSVYLDLIRFLAAVGVFVFHAQKFLLPWLPRPLIDNGAECVAIFFVISGFVIRYVSETKEADWRAYASARMARLYSVALVAIAVTLAADWIGTRADPSVYRGQLFFNPTTGFSEFVAYLTFTNEIWLRHAIVGSDEPYWSLGFEALYYLAFGLAMYIRGPLKYVWMLLWAFVAGPKILAYLPLWLLGVATYDVIRRRAATKPAARPWAGGLVVAASLAGYLVLKYILLGRDRAPMFAPQSMADLACGAAYFSAVGVLVAASIIGFDLATGDRSIWKPGFAKALRWLAGGSFTLYLAHLPLLTATEACFPGVRKHPAEGLLAVGLVFAATLALAELGERRKAFFRQGADWVVTAGRVGAR